MFNIVHAGTSIRKKYCFKTLLLIYFRNMIVQNQITYDKHNKKIITVKWDTFKIHPVKFENRLPIEGKGQG